MKWEKDLIKDIRFHDDRDNIDGPFGELSKITKQINEEFSTCNHIILRDVCDYLRKNGGFKSVLEIGVHRNNEKSSTNTLIQELNGGIYIGIDIEDKSYLNDLTKNIFTIKNDSSKYFANLYQIQQVFEGQFDLILIDGFHSINQVLNDWEYTNLLRTGGAVVFHDITSHPGPHYFLQNINKELWTVYEHCKEDHGIGYAIKL